MFGIRILARNVGAERCNTFFPRLALKGDAESFRQVVRGSRSSPTTE
jgi:hypothetical protein